jgi:hypothetical protein
MFDARLFVLGVSFAALAAIGVCAAPDPSLAQTVSTGSEIKPVGKYTAPASEDDGKARGISGMGCLGSATDAVRECLAVVDDEAFAEIVTLATNELRPTGRTVTFTDTPVADIVGTERPANCGDTGKFREFDGEGIAVAKEYVYVAGSHSCSGGGKYKASSYLLVRFKPSSPTSFGTAPVLERSWRIADVLQHSPVKTFYGKPKADGTNIEGIAVMGDDVYVGLRTPADGDTSYMLRASATALFAPGQRPYEGIVSAIPLPLGKKTGVRDLAALEDGGLLVLSGPADEEPDVAYQVWHLPPPINPATLKVLATIRTSAVGPNNQIAKAESLTVLDESPDKVVVLINYDNVDEGAPERHEIALK